MEDGDEWLAADKLHHLIACFLINVFVSLLAARSNFPFLRRRSAALGSIAALAAGAVKEAADEIGLWRSSGASAKDGAADALGVLLASLLLAMHRRLWPSSRRREPADKNGIASMV